ncbi:MAG: amidoligase family protein [Phocaeicola vulgatus]
MASERYNHDLRPHWKLVTDSSLNVGNDTFGHRKPHTGGREDGLEKLERVCWVLDSCNVKINGSCGLHVHMNAEDFNITTWRNLLLSYKHAEAEIDKFMPASRRGGSNTYCGSLIQFPDERIRARHEALSGNFQGLFPSRYMKVNLQAYSRHRTVEFRQHSGTISFTKIENWVCFLDRMITFASVGSLPAGIRLEDFPFLGEKQKLYYKLRTKKLAV